MGKVVGYEEQIHDVNFLYTFLHLFITIMFFMTKYSNFQKSTDTPKMLEEKLPIIKRERVNDRKKYTDTPQAKSFRQKQVSM